MRTIQEELGISPLAIAAQVVAEHPDTQRLTATDWTAEWLAEKYLVETASEKYAHSLPFRRRLRDKSALALRAAMQRWLPLWVRKWNAVKVYRRLPGAPPESRHRYTNQLPE